MERITDIEKVSELMSPYENETVGFDPRVWLNDDNNIAVLDEEDLGLLEYVSPHTYTGHYFFKSRGKQAEEKILRMLNYAFDKLGVKMIRGITPVKKFGARWMNRHVGCTSHGIVQTEVGPCEIFTLTKQQLKEV